MDNRQIDKKTRQGFLASILIISLLAALFIGYSVQADKPNLLVNGDFERTGDDGFPSNWALAGGELGKNFEVSNDAQSGKSSIRFFDESASIYVAQAINGIIGGTNYEFAAWLKLKKAVSVGGMIKLEYWKIDESGARQFVDSLQNAYSTEQSKWQEQKFSFTAPKDANAVTVMVRMVGGGDVAWDNIKITGQQTKEEAEKTALLDSGEPLPTPAPAKPKDVKKPIDINGELFENGGFENLDENGMPVGWDLFKAGISVDKKNAYSGNNCMKVSTTTGTNPWIRQLAKDVIPGSEYQVSAWYASQDATNIAFKYEFYTENELKAEYGSESAISERYSSTGGQWRQIAETVRVPENAKCVAVYLRLYSNGTVLFDDASIYRTDERIKFTSNTDQVFYYSDNNGYGEGSVKANIDYYPNLADTTVDFALKNGEKVLQNQKNTKIINGEAKFKYDLGLLTEKKKEYTVEFTLKTKDGEIIQTKTQSIYKYDRPTMITKDGDFIVDGKSFNPIFGYHVREKHFKLLAESGVNLVQGVGGSSIAAIKKFLDMAQENGVKVLVPLYNGLKPAGHPDNIELTKKVVSEIKDHPALFGWMVMDEPFFNFVDPVEYLRISYKIIRDIDDVHPVYIMDDSEKNYEKTSKYTDILGIDPYPANKHNPTTRVGDATKWAQEATKYQKPVLTLLQAFDWSGYIPTGDDMRSMIYQSLFEGAKGVGYYTFESSIGKTDLNETDMWPAICGFAKNESKEAFKYFVSGEYKTFNEQKDDDVWYKSYINGNDVYFVILNRTNKSEKTVDITLTSNNGKVTINGFKAELTAGDTPAVINGSGSTMTVKLKPSAALVYKVTPNNATDFSAISSSALIDLIGYPWAKKQIEELGDKGLVNLQSKISFAPFNKITRGDFAYFLIKTLGLTSDSTDNFADVKSDASYAKEVAIGKALGILKGVGDGTYNPETEISRQDLMVICARGMRCVSKLGDEGKSDDLSAYSDYSTIAGYAAGDVSAMIREGIVKGNADGSINPLGNATRAEAAVIMHRILNK